MIFARPVEFAVSFILGAWVANRFAYYRRGSWKSIDDDTVRRGALVEGEAPFLWARFEEVTRELKARTAELNRARGWLELRIADAEMRIAARRQGRSDCYWIEITCKTAKPTGNSKKKNTKRVEKALEGVTGIPLCSGAGAIPELETDPASEEKERLRRRAAPRARQPRVAAVTFTGTGPPALSPIAGRGIARLS